MDRLPQPGETFNPRERDLLVQVYIPIGVLQDQNLGAIEKLLYGRLALYRNLKTGQCNPKIETLSAELGCEGSTIRRALKSLADKKYIRRRQSGPGRAATVEFLWHSSVESSLSARAKTHYQASANLHQEDALPVQECTPASANLSGQASANLHGTYKESEGIHSEGIQESLPLPQQTAVTVERKTTKDAIEFTSEEAAALDFGREQLKEHRYGSFRLSEDEPPAHMVIGILRTLDSREEFSAWIESCPKPRKIDSWGYYAKDARDYWPQRREVALAYAQRRREKAAELKRRTERPWEDYDDIERQPPVPCAICADSGIIGSDDDPDSLRTCSCPQGFVAKHDGTLGSRRAKARAKLRANLCHLCGNSGIASVLSPDCDVPLDAWCECERGVKLRTEDSSLIDKNNELKRAGAAAVARANGRQPKGATA